LVKIIREDVEKVEEPVEGEKDSKYNIVIKGRGRSEEEYEEEAPKKKRKKEPEEEEYEEPKRRQNRFYPERTDYGEQPPLRMRKAPEVKQDELEKMQKRMDDLQKSISGIKVPGGAAAQTSAEQLAMMQKMSEDLQSKLETIAAATSQISKKQQVFDMEDKIDRIESAVGRLQSKPSGGITVMTQGGDPVTTPVIFEFPRVAEDLKSSGVITVGQKSVGDVRGVPTMFALPKAEKTRKISSEWEPTISSTINLRYPLIEPYAYANIRWNEKTQEVIYTLIEPPLTDKENNLLKKLMEMVVDLLDINLMNVTEIGAVKKYLREKIDALIEDYGFDMSKPEYDKLMYYMERNFLGLSTIEPMMQDPQIEDISCDGVSVPIFIFHRKYGSMKANVVFNDEEELNRFVVKLAQRCGKHISVADPLVDGALPDGSRLQATYSSGGDIATKGSTFTIRKFTKDPLTIVDLMTFGTIPATIAAYLWLAIEFRNSVLIAGGTATGKTSCLNTLCLFLHPETKILSIEDTPELALPHEHWVAKISRSGYGPDVGEGKKRGEISMYDLLRAALRERPDELIVGEVRGKEAYVLFQAMATGHAGMATIHAESTEAVINRLITAPISLSTGLLQHLNLILVMTNSRVKGVDVRRIKEVVEILGMDMKTDKPITNELFKWVPSGDYYEFASDRSFILNKIVGEKGISESSVWEELQRRTAILEWMKKEGIRFYKDVGRIIATYYKSPEDILKRVFGGKT
jgi:flagellar protein FlaI